MIKKYKKSNFKFNKDINLNNSSFKFLIKNTIFKIYSYFKRLNKNFLNIERSQKIKGNKIFIKLENSYFLINLKHKLQRNAYIYNQFENRLSEIIECMIKPNSLVIDVGANIGLLSLRFSNILKKKQIKNRNNINDNNFGGKVICFEASENTFKELLFNIDLNKDKNHCEIEAFNLGVGRKNSKEVFYETNIPDMQHSFSFIKNNLFKDLKKTEIIEKKINVISLDNFFIDKFNQEISFIKIDTGGDELEILRGAEQIIKKFNPTIIFEFDKKRIKYLNIDPIKYNLLFNLNYDVYLILEDGFLYQINDFKEAVEFKEKYFEVLCMQNMNSLVQ